MNDRLINKIQLKELNQMDSTEETCELISRVFPRYPQLKKTTTQERTDAIITECLTSPEWMKNIYPLADACKRCISDLSVCISRGLNTSFSYKQFTFYSEVYIELSSRLTGILMEHTCECLISPAGFPQNLSSVPFSDNISTQFDQSIMFLAQIQAYAKEKDSKALAYCLQLLFQMNLENIRILDKLEKNTGYLNTHRADHFSSKS